MKVKASLFSLLVSLIATTGFSQDTIQASFETSPVCLGDETQFINKTFVPSSLGGVDYLWKFGDGSTSTSQFGKHTYQLDDELVTQTFTVTLVVTSKTNPPDVDSAVVETMVYGLPETYFTWKVNNDGQNQEVVIDTLAVDDQNYFYQWTLGGVLKSNDRRPVFDGADLKPYLDGKDYTYTLFMRSPDQCENQYSTTFSYNPLSAPVYKYEGAFAFPNPATDIIYLNENAERISLETLEGKEVLNVNHSDRLNIKQVSAGIYILKTLDGNLTRFQKIVVR